MAAGEITARKRSTMTWMVYVPPQKMPDGTKTAGDRKVVTAYSKTEALNWGKERRAELIEEHRQRQRGELDARKPKVMILTRLVRNVWLPHLRVLCTEQRRKPSGVEAAEATFTMHIEPFVGDKPLNEISNAVVDSLLARWIAGGYEDAKGRLVRPTSSPKTLNNRKTVLNSALKFAVERRIIPLMPCKIDVKHVETDEAEHYPEDVYEQLLDGAVEEDLRTYVAVLLGGDAGLRRNEILAVNVEDVQFATSTIVVRRNVYWEKDGERKMVETLPKGKKVKAVAATSRLIAALKKLVGNRKTGRILLSDDGAQVTPKMLRVWIRRAEKRAGLAKTSGRLHVLRHSHLTHLAEAGANLLQIASQGRHSDLRVTQRYLHKDASAALAAVDLLEKRRAAR